MKKRKILILGITISLFVITSMISYSVGYKAGEDNGNIGDYEIYTTQHINDTMIIGLEDKIYPEIAIHEIKNGWAWTEDDYD